MSDSAPKPFHDLDQYIAYPRLAGLWLSPDGARLVTSVATAEEEDTCYRSALWEVDPTGQQPARRLTRGAKGEASAGFLPGGDLLFTAARPVPGEKDDEPPTSVWRLPAGGGEPRLELTRKGGVGAVATCTTDHIALTAPVMPHAADEEQDEELREKRKKAKVSAIYHDAYPVRLWDHDLGPAVTHAFAYDASARSEVAGAQPDERRPRDLTPGQGWGVGDSGELTPDGAWYVTTIDRRGPGTDSRMSIWAISMADGTRRLLTDDSDAEFMSPSISPDGARVAYLRSPISTPQIAERVELWVMNIDGTGYRQVAADWDRWPASFGSRLVWSPDCSTIYTATDDDGRAPVFRITVDTGSVEQVTHTDAAYSDLRISPDGTVCYALESSYLAPARPVRIALTGQGAGTVTQLQSPVPDPPLPGRLEDVCTVTADGTRVRGWLALPTDCGKDKPAPLVLWIHGGPLGSWNAWSWRWCPWLLVAQGYAVLMPDPALSTGYGQSFVDRGWNRWGAEPYTDTMALTDEVEQREDIDATRTAAMGGSFGGYMANWVAGHTDRFKCIVTHASLWALDQFSSTTDGAPYWKREMDAQALEAYSPHRFVSEIRTPMLVIHGDKDYRVPIGEGLRLWYELLDRSGLPADEEGRSQHRFLYFPSENHWVLTPQHAKVWYSVVVAFLAEHVLGVMRDLPEELG